ncbi:type VI secretion system tube protein Hcp [Salmonella enterica]
MATSLFMKIDGVNGPSTDSDHKGWIEISNLSFGASNNNRMGDSYRPQLTTCTSTADPITVRKIVDSTTTELLYRLMHGQEIKKVEFVSCVMQESKLIEFVKIEIERCSIVDLNFDVFDADGHIPEVITFVYGKFAVTVNPINSGNGNSGKAVMGYDLFANKKLETMV